MGWQPDYITTVELNAFVRVGDTVDDAQAAPAIAAACRAIDKHCSQRRSSPGRQFGIVDTPEQRFYTPRWSRRRCRWVVEIDDLMTSAGLVVATAAGTITEFDLAPRNAAQEGKPWTLLVIRPTNTVPILGEVDEFEPTGKWGWTDIPLAVKEAALLQTSRLVSRRDSPFGIAGSPQLGSELRLLDKVDPDVAVSLEDYVRKGVVFA